MAVFKDLMNAIFNEEVDSDEELDELEEMDEVEEIIEPVVKPVVQVAQPQPVVQEDPQYLHPTPQPVVPVKEQKTSSFVEINLEEKAPKASKSKKVTKKQAPATKARRQDTYDYSPIISPIFGNTEESKKEFDKVHNAIELKKPEVEESFSTIISPMYGNNLPKAKRVIPTMDVDVTLSLDDMLEESKQEKVTQESLFETEE